MWQRVWRDKPDSELIQGCLQGEATAWEALVERYQGLIYSIPLRYGLTPADADDIFQNVCLKLCLHLHELRQQEQLSAYLGAIARQECLRLFRRRPTPSLEDFSHLPESNESLDQALLQEERIHHLRRGLADISPACRELLDLLYGPEPLPYAEVATRLSLPLGSIGPRRARCLEQLKKKIDPYLADSVFFGKVEDS